MSNSLVILSLKEGKFFFNPVARLVNSEFERLTRLRRSLHYQIKRKRYIQSTCRQSFQINSSFFQKWIGISKIEIQKKQSKQIQPNRCLMRLQGQRVHPALSGISWTPTCWTFLTPRRQRLAKHTLLFHHKGKERHTHTPTRSNLLFPTNIFKRRKWGFTGRAGLTGWRAAAAAAAAAAGFMAEYIPRWDDEWFSFKSKVLRTRICQNMAAK